MNIISFLYKLHVSINLARSERLKVRGQSNNKSYLIQRGHYVSWYSQLEKGDTLKLVETRLQINRYCEFAAFVIHNINHPSNECSNRITSILREIISRSFSFHSCRPRRSNDKKFRGTKPARVISPLAPSTIKIDKDRLCGERIQQKSLEGGKRRGCDLVKHTGSLVEENSKESRPLWEYTCTRSMEMSQPCSFLHR